MTSKKINLEKIKEKIGQECKLEEFKFSNIRCPECGKFLLKHKEIDMFYVCPKCYFISRDIKDLN